MRGLTTKFASAPARARREKRRGRRGGSVIVMVALAMIVVFGCSAIAVDYGVLVSDANQLQRACDAAAVGGANKLLTSGSTATAVTFDQYNARQLAIAIAKENGVTITANDVTFPTTNRIRVAATRNRPLFFARALGRDNGRVTRSATAGRVALRGVPGAVPLAMTTDDYYANRDGRLIQYELINNHSEDFKSGTVVGLDLRPGNSGKSPKNFEDDLANGYNGTIYLNQNINNALNANLASQGAKFEDAILSRIAAARQAPYNDTGSNFTYPNYPPDDPRVVMLIVAPPSPSNNNNPMVTAVFLVPVYLQVVNTPNKKNATLQMRILPILTYNSQNPGIALDSPDATITGPSVVTLMN